LSATAHHEAVVAFFRDDPQLASSTFELGKVPTPAPSRYVVVVSSLGDWSKSRWTGLKDALTTTHTVYCVGDAVWQVLAVADRVSRLKDVRLSVEGRNVFLPDPWIARPISNDTDGLFPKPYGVIQFDLYSEPA
jgi:hypothetical protein